jgi:hypothetical protein
MGCRFAEVLVAVVLVIEVVVVVVVAVLLHPLNPTKTIARRIDNIIMIDFFITILLS